MADYTIKEIEDAILAALTDRLGTYVKTIESYQGQLEADLGEFTWRLPAALITLQDTRVAKAAAHSYDLKLTFTIIVADRNLRGNQEGRWGNTGAYQMLEDVRSALWDQDLGLEINPFMLLEEEAVINNRQVAVFAADYQTQMVVNFD
ncbi:MAG: phage protein Gp37 [Desulfobacteraceae bacterium]